MVELVIFVALPLISLILSVAMGGWKQDPRFKDEKEIYRS